MGRLTRLEIHSFRNISHCAISPDPELNVIVGANASGKTSLLEAIHYLALGRSFRSSHFKPLIQSDQAETILFGELSSGASAGLRKSRKGEQQIKLNGKAVRGWESIAREMPVQLLDTTSFSLLTEGPKLRRRFIDWGVFHVEHAFLPAWRRAHKALLHRNSLLRQPGKPDVDQLSAWEEELVAGALQITALREAYCQRLLTAFSRALHTLDEHLGEAVALQFHAGWNREHELAGLLKANRESDQAQGSTRHGPHRADLFVRSGNHRAVDVLSRGQQKLVVSALKVAQGELFFETREQRPIYLIDDLAAELDERNRKGVFDLLQSLGAQLFVTCVNRKALGSSFSDPMPGSLFHVEHGTITV